MLRILDRYIIRLLLSTFLFVVLILVTVILIIDLAEHMDKFAAANLHAPEIIGYYLDFIPWVAGLITPITSFIATVYITSRLASHTEIIAMLGSGASFRRLLVPYLLSGALIGAASFVLNGWVIPNSNRSRVAFEVAYLQSTYYYDKQNIHIQVGPDVYLYMRSYDNHTNTGYSFTLEKLDSGQLVEKLNARTIRWDSVKQKWILSDWNVEQVKKMFSRIEGRKVSAPDSLADSLHGQLIEPLKSVPGINYTKTLVSKGQQMDTALLIKPDEFENDYRKYDAMTINDLNRHIRALKARGSAGIATYEVEKYQRYAHPFTIIILTFMGVIVSSKKSRGGTGFQIALGFVLSFIFILFFIMFRTFAEAGALHPSISVWIPSLIFGGISLFMYRYVPK